MKKQKKALPTFKKFMNTHPDFMPQINSTTNKENTPILTPPIYKLPVQCTISFYDEFFEMPENKYKVNKKTPYSE